MTDANSILRDFLVAISDRKLELTGRKWAMARASAEIPPIASSAMMQRPAARTHADVPRGRVVSSIPIRSIRETWQSHHWADQDPAQLPAPDKLEMLLGLTTYTMRWEIGGGVVDHRGVASAAALHPIDMFLSPWNSDSARSIRFYCSPTDHALIAEVSGHASEWSEEVDILLVGRLARCTSDYGNLSLALATIEAGMRLTQLHFASALLGWSCEASLARQAAPGETGTSHWSDLPIVSLNMGGAGLAMCDLRPLPAACLALPLDTSSADDHPALRQMVLSLGEARSSHELRLYNDSSARAGAGGIPAAEVLLPAMMHRSSGPNDRVSRQTVTFGPDHLYRYLEAVSAIFRISLGGLEQKVSIGIGVRHARTGSLAHYHFFPQTGVLHLDAPSRSSGHPHSVLPGHQFCLVTIGLDLVSEMGRLGPRSFLSSHVVAGAIAQCFCVAAAWFGMTARPLRSYVDKDANMPLALDFTALLQIQIGPDDQPSCQYWAY